MQIKEIQKVYRAQPFRPFIIHMADGRGIRVDHPEFMALSPAGRAAVVFDKDGGFEVIDVLLVTGLEVGNGKSSSRRKRK
jgi:hypothetical protein